MPVNVSDLAARIAQDLRVTIAMACVDAVIEGMPTVTISTRGKRPPGFPRGELLSVGTSGASNYAVDPIKVLAWLRDSQARLERQKRD